ncbi:hypothetical protein FBZ99_101330 [Rhizobium sp. ERR 1071]|uniref:hypothetical protein n=1 Tax=Rhizobium sp. ERR 1071 TaxID=2572677 RepID=UPI00119A974C|nr:hypothetical protein [Rhizobium sp. ERR1071]TWB19557.1 hypothetical protein FBZ99_101330 [Rhizobium sp. ERR1071]
MHIFIDESGTFAGVGSGKPAVSAIGALILTSYSLPKLFNRYQQLRTNFPKRNGEVKGSLLNEMQVAAVVELLRKNDAIFCASMIDLGVHNADDITAHRDGRSASLSANLTNGHTQELRDGVAALQARMAGFPDQLYVQSVVMTDLLFRVMQEMILYHCQRFPKELAEFHWVVDAKHPAAVTDWEDWWYKTLMVWLQAMSIERPADLLPGGDYRHFERFFIAEVPEYLRDKVPPGDRTRGAGVNLQLMYGESFRFSSDPEAGLELVDIATNALRRALVGNLGQSGWLPLRRLMIHRSDLYVKPVGLMRDEDRKLAPELAKVMNKFREGGRIMAIRNLQWPEKS